ncbi:MAG: hypothetical protein EB058_15250, partial [Proteobacteria bacterium]|nr:hypothetical protein [Pseudomonadota bacterium]
SSSVGTTYFTHTVASGNDATVTVSVTGPDTAGNPAVASGTTTFAIDTTVPTVALTYSIASSVPANATAAAALTYSASASRPVKVGDIVVVKAVTTESTALASALSLALDGSRTITALEAYTTSTSVGTTYFTHTVATGNDGTATVSVTGPDTAGNAAVALTEVVALSAAPTITLTATGGVTTVTSTSMTQVGSSLVYTYAYTVQASENGTVSASVSATDTATNALTSTAATAFIVDNTAPAVVLTYTDNGAANVTGPYKSGDSVTVTATFTETNALYGTPTLSLVAGTWTGTGGATLPAVTLSNGGSGLAYTGTFTIPAGNGTVTATVGATDTAGNTLSASGQTGFTIDNTAPTYAITYSRTAPLSAGAVTVTVTASEALSAVPVISIDQPGTTDISSAATSGSGPYTYVYTVVLANAGTYVDGTATVSVSGTDLAGNTGTTVTSGGTFAIDTTAPVVSSVVRASSAAALTTGASAPVFTVTFSESVSGVTAANFAVNAGSGIGGTAPTIASVTGTGTAWTVTLGVTGTTGDYGSNTNATLGLTVVPASNAVDAAGNALASATVSGTNESYNLDTTSATVSGVTSTLADGSYKAGQAVPVTVTFSEPVTVVTSGGTPQLTLTTGSSATTLVSYTSGSGTAVLTFTYTVASGDT